MLHQSFECPTWDSKPKWILVHTYIVLTEAFVESDQGHRQPVTFVDDRVVAMLGHPALGRAVHGGRVHQPMADVHGDDGAVMGLEGLYAQYIDLDSEIIATL